MHILSPFRFGCILLNINLVYTILINEILLSRSMVAYWNVEKGEVVLCNSVDISIAVATEKV